MLIIIGPLRALHSFSGFETKLVIAMRFYEVLENYLLSFMLARFDSGC